VTPAVEVAAATAVRDAAGARTVLEAFYRAVNTADLTLLRAVWLDDPLVQLIPPHRPGLRGPAAIAAHYRMLLSRGRGLRLEPENFVEIGTDRFVIFAGHERGAYLAGHDTVPLHQRVTYCCAHQAAVGGWRLVYGHASLIEPAMLARFQRAATQATSPGRARHPDRMGADSDDGRAERDQC
jgi:hypothetical protein